VGITPMDSDASTEANNSGNPTEGPHIRVPDPWEYEQALTQVVRDAHAGFVNDHPVLSEIPRIITRHGAASRIDTEGGPVRHAQYEFSAEYGIHRDAIEHVDDEAYAASISGLIDQMVANAARMVFEHVGHVCDAAGTSVDAQGKPMSHDLMLDLIESVHISFNENGDPEMPTLYVPPDARPKVDSALAPPATAEQEARYRAIMRKKKREWHAAKRTRRIS